MILQKIGFISHTYDKLYKFKFNNYLKNPINAEFKQNFIY